MLKLTSRFVLVFLPLALYFLWLGVRVVKRSRPNRFTATTAFSLVVLAYFLAVVGTGIFWVASQELPIFDWHYLPGYLLLAVALVHVTLHWRNVASLLSGKAPDVFIEPDSGRFRFWVRIAAYGLLALAAGGVVYSIGVRQGSRYITIVTGESHQGLTAEPLIPPVFVEAGGKRTTLAEYYHTISSYPRVGLRGLTVSARQGPYKEYPEKPVISLPPVRSEGGGSVEDAYHSWAAGRARSDQGGLTLDRLSELLSHTLGVSRPAAYNGLRYDLRTAPSAGALYPVNIYVLASKVQGLAPGLYYYHAKRSALYQIRSDPALTVQLQMLSGSPELLTDAPATVIFTATFGRTDFKYQQRTYRYVVMEVGHAACNLGLCAASIGLRAPMIGRFDDQALNTFLDINPSAEAGLLIMPLGSSRATSPEPVFQREPMGPFRASVIDLIHKGTSIRRVGMKGGLPRHPPHLEAGLTGMPLPVPARGKPLLEAITLRRSVREYGPTPMSREELAALCAASAGDSKDILISDPLFALSSPLTLSLIVRDVKGVRPGVYRYLPASHALHLLKEGDYSRQLAEASMRQEFVGTAAVVFVLSAKWKDILSPDGDRGYRYVHVRAGAMGEGIYLQGASLGIGVCSIGAFQDSSIAGIIGLDFNEEIPIYEIVAGK